MNAARVTRRSIVINKAAGSRSIRNRFAKRAEIGAGGLLTRGLELQMLTQTPIVFGLRAEGS